MAFSQITSDDPFRLVKTAIASDFVQEGKRAALAEGKRSKAFLDFRDDTFSFLGLSKARFFTPGGGVFAIPVQVCVSPSAERP